MRGSWTLWCAACTALWLGSAAQPQVFAPILDRCCREDEVFSVTQTSCVPRTFSFSRLDAFQTIEPAFASQVFSQGEVDYDAAPNFQLREQPRLPQCNPDTEDLKYLVNPGNEAKFSTFFLDDLNVTGSIFSLVDQVGFDKYEVFCLDKGFQGQRFVGTVVAFCQTRSEIVCRNRTCVHQCCQQGQVYDPQLGDCSPPHDPDPKLEGLDFVTDDGQPSEIPADRVKYFFEKIPDCSIQMFHKFAVLESGRLKVGTRVAELSEYCVERMEVLDEAAGTYSYPFMASVCLSSPDRASKDHRRWSNMVDLTLVPILFLISLVFLGLLFMYVYTKNRHKLFGVMTLCLTSMLFLFYAGLLSAKILGPDFVHHYHNSCLVLGFFIQYFYLSAIFWLNAMSCDIWATFRQMRTVPDHSQARAGWRHSRFKWYALYSWGCPLLISAATVTMQFLPDDLTKDLVTPGIGRRQCFLDSTYAMVFYLNIFIAPLLCINIGLFVSSMWNLCCGIWADKSGDPVLRAQQKTRYVTCVKMFFAMGIPWLLEAISHVLDWTYGAANVRNVVVVFKIVNSLQGFILFCVVFFDSVMVNLLKQKLCGIEPRRRLTHNGTLMSSVRATNTTSATDTVRRKMSRLLPDRLRTRLSQADLNNPERIELRDGSAEKTSPRPSPCPKSLGSGREV